MKPEIIHNKNFEHRLFRLVLLVSMPFWLTGVIWGAIIGSEIVIIVLETVFFFIAIITFIGLEKKFDADILIKIFCLSWLIGFVFCWRVLGGMDGPFSYSYFVILVLYVGLLRGYVRYAFSIVLCGVCLILTFDRTSQIIFEIDVFDGHLLLALDYLLNSILIAALVVFIKMNFDKEQREIQAHNNDLQELSDEMRLKHGLLVQQEFEIKKLQSNLSKIVEERTQELQNKNDQLEDYAYKNAHIVRAPLSNILGLINILKENENSGVLDEKLLMEIDELSQSLDLVVGKINTILQ